MELDALHNSIKQALVSDRYITNTDLERVLPTLSEKFRVEVIGHSVQDRPIYNVTIGTGSTKVYMWSQMHGNESTTTKGLLDLFCFLDSDASEAQGILNQFTLFTIPILNPDGAFAYTRVNANQVDLNRDSIDLSQPESQLLRACFEAFRPDYCLNLHDQRTIFGVGDTDQPATLSFLAPSYNEERSINDNRQIAINIISHINKALQAEIPGQVGRFDDGFNINCIGDYFQSQGVPTILYEAGHYPGDYAREKTRKYVFLSLLSFFDCILQNAHQIESLKGYLQIPENKKSFFDIIIKNIQINEADLKKVRNFAVQYKEILTDNSIVYAPYIAQIDNLEDFHGHYVHDFKGTTCDKIPFSSLKLNDDISTNFLKDL